jgi:hypothetical protein
MQRRRSILSGLLGLSVLVTGLVLPATVAASEPAPVIPAPDCVGHWPAAFQGRPTLLHAGARAGDYIWHDANGWHLRVTHKGHGKVTFTGKIVSSAPLTVTPARLEKADTWSLSADKKTLTYKFYNYGHVDGLDFKTDCAARLSFRGSMSGEKLPTSRIWIGAHNRHPLSNRFVVVRVS